METSGAAVQSLSGDVLLADTVPVKDIKEKNSRRVYPIETLGFLQLKNLLPFCDFVTD
jgi:hypothetical protein